MNFFGVLKKRRSIRKFKDKDVSLQLIKKVIDSTRYAPSGLNKQPWEFIVIRDKQKRKKIKNIYENARNELGLYKQDCDFVEKATQVIVCNNTKLTKNLISTSLAIQNMLLTATAFGLGSIVMTAAISRKKDVSEIRRLCNIPEHLELIALVLIGYADEKPKMKPRKPLRDIMHIDGIKC